MNKLDNLKDELAKQVFGEDVLKKREAGLCVYCGEPAMAKCHSEAGRREVAISGLCEVCWDECFGTDE